MWVHGQATVEKDTAAVIRALADLRLLLEGIASATVLEMPRDCMSVAPSRETAAADVEQSAVMIAGGVDLNCRDIC